jgi:hypothetical protein
MRLSNRLIRARSSRPVKKREEYNARGRSAKRSQHHVPDTAVIVGHSEHFKVADRTTRTWTFDDGTDQFFYAFRRFWARGEASRTAVVLTSSRSVGTFNPTTRVRPTKERSRRRRPWAISGFALAEVSRSTSNYSSTENSDKPKSCKLVNGRRKRELVGMTFGRQAIPDASQSAGPRFESLCAHH